jgi:hypothetical protein
MEQRDSETAEQGQFPKIGNVPHLRNVYVVACLVVVHIHAQAAEVVAVFGPGDCGPRLPGYLGHMLFGSL